MRQIAPGFSIWEVCQALSVSRSAYYAYLQGKTHHHRGAKADIADRVEEVFVEHRRRYGYRRVTAELRRRGMLVNHKRVAGNMRADNLLAVQPRQFVTTTDSSHALEIYLNLARRMHLTGPDQLWVADITYVRAGRVCVPGGDSGRFLAQGGRLEAGPHAGQPSGE